MEIQALTSNKPKRQTFICGIRMRLFENRISLLLNSKELKTTFAKPH